MLKHIFFDLDNTLTPSRQPILPAHAPLFVKLCAKYDIIAVSGQELASFRKQLPEGTPYYVLAQVGNHAFDKNGVMLWQEKPTEEQTRAVLDFISMLRKTFPMPVKDENDIVELRGSLIGFSLIGHHEDPNKKAALDPGSLTRNRMLGTFPKEVQRLHDIGIDVSAAGTTTIEFFLAGKNKGFNILRLIEREGWNKDECVYVGDELEPGRNDETVIGVIPTRAVKDPEETFAFVAEMLE